MLFCQIFPNMRAVPFTGKIRYHQCERYCGDRDVAKDHLEIMEIEEYDDDQNAECREGRQEYVLARQYPDPYHNLKESESMEYHQVGRISAHKLWQVSYPARRVKECVPGRVEKRERDPQPQNNINCS